MSLDEAMAAQRGRYVEARRAVEGGARVPRDLVTGATPRLGVLLGDAGEVWEVLGHVAQRAAAAKHRELRERLLRRGGRHARAVGSWQVVTGPGVVKVVSLRAEKVRVATVGAETVGVVPLVMRVRIPWIALPAWTQSRVNAVHRGAGLCSLEVPRIGGQVASVVIDVWVEVVDPPTVALRYRKVRKGVREEVLAVPHGFSLSSERVARYALARKWRCAGGRLRAALGLGEGERSPLLGALVEGTRFGAAMHTVSEVAEAAYLEAAGRVVCHRGNLSLLASPKVTWMSLVTMAAAGRERVDTDMGLMAVRSGEGVWLRGGVLWGRAIAGVFSPWWEDQESLRGAWARARKVRRFRQGRGARN